MSLTYGFCLGDLSGTYDSQQFAETFRHISGDGVAPQSGRFAAEIQGFGLTIAAGFALKDGRYLVSDEPLTLVLSPAGNYGDRYDAVAVRVDLEARKAFLEVVPDVDPARLPEGCLVLYLVKVRRGATDLHTADVTDVRTYLTTLAEVSGDVLYIYNFLTSGIDQRIAQLLALSAAVIRRAEQAIVSLDAAIQEAGGSYGVGELQTARRDPGAGWLLCSGGPVPAQYPALCALLGGTLPNLSQPGDRYRTYIFGGVPEGE